AQREREQQARLGNSATRRFAMHPAPPAAAALQTQAPQEALLGEWKAVLAVGSSELRLRLDISRDCTAVLTSVAQGNSKISSRLMRDACRDAIVHVEWPSLAASFHGELERCIVSGNEEHRIRGTFRQSGFACPLAWQRREARSRPPARCFDEKLLRQLWRQSGAPALCAATARASPPSTSIHVVGTRSCRHPAPATVDDLWHVGSMTKSMTATLVARLVDAGELTWDTTVGSLL